MVLEVIKISLINKLLHFFQNINIIINYILKTETNEKLLFNKILKNNKIVIIDIGSNNGSFFNSLEKKLKNKELTIHSVEPIKEILKNQKTKRSKLIKHNLAITDSIGKTKFRKTKLSSNSYIENSTLESYTFKSKFEEIEVKTSTLDNFVLQNNLLKIDILKIDTEGQEFNILDSSEGLLKQKIIKIIKIELNFLNNNQKEFYKIIDLLNKYEYKFVGISNIKFKNEIVWFLDGYFVQNDYL